MVRTYSGKMIAKGRKFGIVVSRFNEFITSRLLAGALDTLRRHDAEEAKIDVVWVPGGFEIPYAAKKLALSKKYDSVICLGAVIKGDTPHFDYISNEVAKGVSQISLSTGVPVIFGIITADNLEQAIERAGAKSGNKGAAAALSAIEMVDLFKKIK